MVAVSLRKMVSGNREGRERGWEFEKHHYCRPLFVLFLVNSGLFSAIRSLSEHKLSRSKLFSAIWCSFSWSHQNQISRDELHHEYFVFTPHGGCILSGCYPRQYGTR